MTSSRFPRLAILAIGALFPLFVLAAPKAEVKGTLVVGGADAKIAHVRARKMVLDNKGNSGYAVLLSAKPAEGDLPSWKTADPHERGNFLYVIFDAKGEIWVYELGHTNAKSGHGHFGGVTEIKKVAFEVKGGQLMGHIRTNGEQNFSDDRFTVDLTFETPVEEK